VVAAAPFPAAASLLRATGRPKDRSTSSRCSAEQRVEAEGLQSIAARGRRERRIEDRRTAALIASPHTRIWKDLLVPADQLATHRTRPHQMDGRARGKIPAGLAESPRGGAQVHHQAKPSARHQRHLDALNRPTDQAPGHRITHLHLARRRNHAARHHRATGLRIKRQAPTQCTHIARPSGPIQLEQDRGRAGAVLSNAPAADPIELSRVRHRRVRRCRCRHSRHVVSTMGVSRRDIRTPGTEQESGDAHPPEHRHCAFRQHPAPRDPRMFSGIRLLFSSRSLTRPEGSSCTHSSALGTGQSARRSVSRSSSHVGRDRKPTWSSQ